jgi:hypothetical protein
MTIRSVRNAQLHRSLIRKSLLTFVIPTGAPRKSVLRTLEREVEGSRECIFHHAATGSSPQNAPRNNPKPTTDFMEEQNSDLLLGRCKHRYTTQDDRDNAQEELPGAATNPRDLSTPRHRFLWRTPASRRSGRDDKALRANPCDVTVQPRKTTLAEGPAKLGTRVIRAATKGWNP